MSMTGLQMAFAYVGTCLMPPLFGLLAQNITAALYPYFLAVMLVLMLQWPKACTGKPAQSGKPRRKTAESAPRACAAILCSFPVCGLINPARLAHTIPSGQKARKGR